MAKRDAAALWNNLNTLFAKVISEVDERDAIAAVTAMREAHPEETVEQIIERLIRDTCLQTAGIGAASAAAAILPGLGTAASLTVGVAADIGATFKLQAELVLEIAAARNYTLSETEKRTAVMAITGVSSGANQALKAASTKALTRYAEKWVAHALPVVGVGASAGLNALTTYVVGQRANAYFALGPEAMVDYWKTLAALSGIDVNAVGAWVASNAAASWEVATTGASATGSAIVSGASAAGGMVSSGASATATAFVDGASAAASYVTAGVSSIGSAGRWTADTLAAYAKGGLGAVSTAGHWVSGSVMEGASAVKRQIWNRREEQTQPDGSDQTPTPPSASVEPDAEL